MNRENTMEEHIETGQKTEKSEKRRDRSKPVGEGRWRVRVQTKENGWTHTFNMVQLSQMDNFVAGWNVHRAGYPEPEGGEDDAARAGWKERERMMYPNGHEEKAKTEGQEPSLTPL